ncbi:MAG: SEC-C metal-binding domain-containing protein, partial [bacterium]|nr:SEC-C metal-binding domain-containing protein [bacterium]
YQEKTKDIAKNDTRNIERFVILRTVDTIWMEHLDTMECLRDSVRLRAYGQRDPLVEYKNEGGKLFREVLQEIDNGIVDVLLKAEFKEQPSDKKRQVGLPAEAPRGGAKAGRNDPCPCGSGKKYKKCCGK